MIRIEIESKDLKMLKLLEYLRLLPGVRVFEDEVNIVNEEDLPYSENIPNETTAKSLRESMAGKGTRTKGVKDMMRKLNSL